MKRCCGGNFCCFKHHCHILLRSLTGLLPDILSLMTSREIHGSIGFANIVKSSYCLANFLRRKRFTYFMAIFKQILTSFVFVRISLNIPLGQSLNSSIFLTLALLLMLALSLTLILFKKPLKENLITKDVKYFFGEYRVGLL